MADTLHPSRSNGMSASNGSVRSAENPADPIRHQSCIQFAIKVLESESNAVANVAAYLDDQFIKAVEKISLCTGSVILAGVGKSGLIARKIAATFASTGTPSHFLHPTEAMHGDFGSVRSGDILLLLSFSGQTAELVSFAAVAANEGLPIISMTGTRECQLAKLSKLSLLIGSITEACPHNLAPTASTTAMLALGDALALSVSRRREFTMDEFHRRHPGGDIGKLLLPLSSIGRFRLSENLPVISDSLTVCQVLQQLNQSTRRAGAALLVDESGALSGIFTDADLRRMVAREGASSIESPIAEHMTRRPSVLRECNLVRDALRMMLDLRIDEIPLIDDTGRPTGLIDVQDLIALGVMGGN